MGQRVLPIRVLVYLSLTPDFHCASHAAPAMCSRDCVLSNAQRLSCFVLGSPLSHRRAVLEGPREARRCKQACVHHFAGEPTMLSRQTFVRMFGSSNINITTLSRSCLRNDKRRVSRRYTIQTCPFTLAWVAQRQSPREAPHERHDSQGPPCQTFAPAHVVMQVAQVVPLLTLLMRGPRYLDDGVECASSLNQANENIRYGERQRGVTCYADPTTRSGACHYYPTSGPVKEWKRPLPDTRTSENQFLEGFLMRRFAIQVRFVGLLDRGFTVLARAAERSHMRPLISP